MASSSGSVAGSGTENRGFIKPTGDNIQKKNILDSFGLHALPTVWI
jgi:hypothetical protein